MAKSILTRPYFSDEAAAFAKLEGILWPNGPTCPKCGATDRIGTLEGVKDKKGRVRLGIKKCYHCRSQFTVRVGTVFEDSHVPLHLWFQAVYLLCSSKKGISSNQLHRTLGVTLKTAWFMSHRIREAMREGKLDVPFGGRWGIVEVDETFIGHDKTKKPKGDKKVRGYGHKYAVLSLIDRDTGKARSVPVDDLKRETLLPILRENIAREATIMTDEAGQYRYLKREFNDHQVVNHSAEEYVRGEAHTNTAEGFFSIFKRGMKGIYQHCGKKHLHRYLAEFDFRYNNRIALGVDDAERTVTALIGAIGKRLTYRNPDEEKVRGW
jgi:transposase-like protein